MAGKSGRERKKDKNSPSSSSCFVVFRRLFFVAPGKTGKKEDFMDKSLLMFSVQS